MYTQDTLDCLFISTIEGHWATGRAVCACQPVPQPSGAQASLLIFLQRTQTDCSLPINSFPSTGYSSCADRIELHPLLHLQYNNRENRILQSKSNPAAVTMMDVSGLTG